MTKYPVPQEYIIMWRTMTTALGKAQDWLDEAIEKKDEGKIRVYSKMVLDRTSAIGNLQQIIWGPMLERMALRPGMTHKRVRTAVSTDPPEMILFDSEEEYFAALQDSIKEASAEGKGVVDAHMDGNAPVKPFHPEEN